MKKEKLFIKENNSIKFVLKKFKFNIYKTFIVVDKNKKLLGTLTEGDLRKEIIKNININNPIKNFYNKKAKFFVKDNFTHLDAKTIITKKKFLLIPIIDKDHKVINYLTWTDIINNKIKKKYIYKNKFPIVVMAGGKGERLKPFTEVLPKPLIPLGNQTVIEKIIDSFIKQKLSNFYFIIRNTDKILEYYLKDKFNKIVKIKFIKENRPLGNSGGLYFLKKKNLNNFLLINCDTVLTIDYHSVFDYHLKNKNHLTILVSTKKEKIPYGICNFDKNKNFINIDEKPKIKYSVNTSLYIINKKILSLINKKKKEDMNELIKKAKDKKFKVKVYEIDHNLWKDVGEWRNYKKTLQDIEI